MVPVRCTGHMYKLRCFTCSQLLSFNTDLSEVRLSGPLRDFYTRIGRGVIEIRDFLYKNDWK